jgi:hypothetical protein
MIRKILVGLTTTSPDWRERLVEINRLNIIEIAFFPTCLDIGERKEAYGLLDKSCVRSIPHVHLRGDMEEWELELFVGRYGAKAFNIHAEDDGPDMLRFSEFRPMIYIENRIRIGNGFEDIVRRCGGLCIDFSHWEDFRQQCGYGGYDRFADLVKQFKIGCSHISAMRGGESCHYLSDPRELDYLGFYLGYLPELVSIELENTIEEQLVARSYIENLIIKHEKAKDTDIGVKR